MEALWAEAGTEWISLVSTTVNVGFSIVVGIYLLTKAIPKMQADHAKALAEQRVDYIADLKTKRTEFLLELKEREKIGLESLREIRGDFKESIKTVVEHCEREGERRDKLMQVEIANMTRALEDQGKIIDEFRMMMQDFRRAMMK